MARNALWFGGVMGECIKKIVVGYDFSESSVEACRMAASLAAAAGAKVILAVAFPGHLPQEMLGLAGYRRRVVSDFSKLVRFERRLEHLVLRTLGDLPFSGVDLDVVTVFAARNVERALLLVAQDQEADLIVVGDHQHGRARRWGVGATSERLVKRSSLPVMVVRAHERPLSRVLCPVNLDQPSFLALSWAANVARLHDARLYVVALAPRVVHPAFYEVMGISMPSSADENARARERLREICEAVDMSGTRMACNLLDRVGHELLLDDIRAGVYGMICVLSTTHSFLEVLQVGNSAQRLLRGLPASVLSIHNDEFAIRRGGSWR